MSFTTLPTCLASYTPLSAVKVEVDEGVDLRTEITVGVALSPDLQIQPYIHFADPTTCQEVYDLLDNTNKVALVTKGERTLERREKLEEDDAFVLDQVRHSVAQSFLPAADRLLSILETAQNGDLANISLASQASAASHIQDLVRAFPNTLLSYYSTEKAFTAAFRVYFDEEGGSEKAAYVLARQAEEYKVEAKKARQRLLKTFIETCPEVNETEMPSTVADLQRFVADRSE